MDSTEVEYDNWFRTVIPASILALKNLINRDIVETQEELDAILLDDETSSAILFNESLKLGALMLIGHWFANRESSTALSINETPMALDYLVQPYRKMAGVE